MSSFFNFSLYSSFHFVVVIIEHFITFQLRFVLRVTVITLKRAFVDHSRCALKRREISGDAITRGKARIAAGKGETNYRHTSVDERLAICTANENGIALQLRSLHYVATTGAVLSS